MQRRLTKESSPTSDQSLWIAEAEQFGHAKLVDALWERTEAIYVDGQPDPNHATGPLHAERAALGLWAARTHTDWQRSTLNAIRGLLYDNLVYFDVGKRNSRRGSANLRAKFGHLVSTPRTIERQNVRDALALFRFSARRSNPMQLVDRNYLVAQTRTSPGIFVARPPMWRDVAHGPSWTTRYIERQQTAALVNVQKDSRCANVDHDSRPSGRYAKYSTFPGRNPLRIGWPQSEFTMKSTTFCGSGCSKWWPFDLAVPSATEMISIAPPSCSSRCFSR